MTSSKPKSRYRPLSLVAQVSASQGRKIKQTLNTHKVRDIFLESGTQSHTSGSAYMELGATKVICGVSGPRAQTTGVFQFNQVGLLNCSVQILPFASAPVATGKTVSSQSLNDERKAEREVEAREKQLADALTRALAPSIQLHKYPKCVIDVAVVLVQDDGGALNAATSCASLALADAGVHLFDMVGSCRLALQADSKNTDFIIDPTKAQEDQATCVLSMALMPSLRQMTEISVKGRIQPSTLYTAQANLLKACADVTQKLRVHLVRKSSESDPRNEK